MGLGNNPRWSANEITTQFGIINARLDARDDNTKELAKELVATFEAMKSLTRDAVAPLMEVVDVLSMRVEELERELYGE